MFSCMTTDEIMNFVMTCNTMAKENSDSKDTLEDSASEKDEKDNHANDYDTDICDTDNSICDKEYELNQSNQPDYLNKPYIRRRFAAVYYNEDEEIYDEQITNDYHKEKLTGNWQYAKMIVAHSHNNNYYQNNQHIPSVFIWDYLDILFKNNNDEFANIKTVYYKNNLDIDLVYCFKDDIARYVVENLKINGYKSVRFLGSMNKNINKWDFKIVVVTTKDIYNANGYISSDMIGYIY